MDRLQAAVDRTGFRQVAEDFDDLRLEPGRHREIGIVPIAAHAEPLELLALLLHPLHRVFPAAAAHFELANHLWRAGERDLAIAHFNACHRLQPDNWTYRRQAYSLVAAERVDGPAARFAQGPLAGEEDAWPFASDFRSDVESLEGAYYPRTL